MSNKEFLTAEDIKVLKDLNYAIENGTHLSIKDLKEAQDIASGISAMIEEAIRESDDLRVFFVVSSDESEKEIFHSFREAEMHLAHISDEPNAIITIDLVRHAFKDEDGKWNYDDYADTFKTISVEVK